MVTNTSGQSVMKCGAFEISDGYNSAILNGVRNSTNLQTARGKIHMRRVEDSRPGESHDTTDSPQCEVTRQLHRLPDDSDDAVRALFPLVYDDLRRLAGRSFQGQSHTLQPTALVHEAFIRLTRDRSFAWTDRRHFFAVAAVAMRQILVNHAQARSAAKRGGGRKRISLDDDAPAGAMPDELVLAVDAAVRRLAEHDAECARVVELRFFGGLTIADVAEVMGKSPRSIDRCWQFARSWLHRELTNGD